MTTALTDLTRLFEPKCLLAGFIRSRLSLTVASSAKEVPVAVPTGLNVREAKNRRTKIILEP
jgi:hypothetical protein